MITRRRFLGFGAGTAGLAALPRWMRCAAAPVTGDPSRVLVVVQLMGGNDGLNTVVPLDDDRYARLRPNLALRKQQVLALDERNGFHSSLANLRARFGEGEVAIVHGVGHAHPNLSHFRSQAIWEAASEQGSASRDGWLGRHHDACDRAGSPVALLALGRDSLPLALRSRTSAFPAIPDLAAWRLQGSAPVIEGEEGEDSLGRVRDCMRSALEASEALGRASGRSTRAAYPDHPLGRSLKSAADVVVAGLPVRCVWVTLPGFDTHTEQLEEHARLLARLDASLDAFLADLETEGAHERVLVATISEFGRRPAESGLGELAGTDHGTASTLLVAGARVRGGILGEQPDLDDLDPHGNPGHRVDFRSLYATLIEDWLGGNAEPVLGAAYPKLELVRS